MNDILLTSFPELHRKLLTSQLHPDDETEIGTIFPFLSSERQKYVLSHWDEIVVKIQERRSFLNEEIALLFGEDSQLLTDRQKAKTLRPEQKPFIQIFE